MQDENQTRRFIGASKYVLDEELANIVNITMALEIPLLLKGEPGFGLNLDGLEQAVNHMMRKH
jgi:MoxR-like ATPase